MTLQTLKSALIQKIKDNEKRMSFYEFTMSKIGEMNSKKSESAEQISVCSKSLELLENVANSRRSELKNRIESIVTEALRAIYGENYRLEMTYSIKSNRSDLSFEVVKKTNNGEVRRELGGFGLGVADTIAVPLRLLVLVGTKGTDKVCLLDESYKHAYEGDVEEIGKFLSSISDLLKVQLIVCTHHPEFKEYSDSVYEVSIEDGTSKVTRNEQ